MVENISIEDGMEQEETFGFKPNMYGKDLTRVIKILFEKHVLEECFNKELEHEISHHLSQSEMRELMDHLKSSHQRCIDQVVRAAMKYMKMLIFPPGKYLSLPGGEDIIEQMQAAKTRVIETQSRFIRALDKHKALLQIRERMLGELLYLETNKEQLSGLNREMKGYHPSKHIDSLHEHLNRLHDIKEKEIKGKGGIGADISPHSFVSDSSYTVGGVHLKGDNTIALFDRLEILDM